MRILVVGDTHGDLPWVQTQVIPTATEYDCPTIMQLGDFGFVWDNDLAAVEDTLGRLSQVLAVAHRRLVFLPGNHENHPMLAELCRRRFQAPPEMFWELAPSIFYTGRVASWVWTGHTVVALGGATSIDRPLRVPGHDWWPEEQLSAEEAQQAKRMARRLDLRDGRVDVLFSHDGPTCVPLHNLVPDRDSELHRLRISDVAGALRPRCWMHGHYHHFAEYRFPLKRGHAEVTALDCNNRHRTRSMKLLELDRAGQPTPDGC